MPKIIELTVELEIQRVSCPGVWLCQDGRVSLTVFALGTSYQTCLLPPMFPLLFKDVFYFRKRFQETCALNNICCLLKDETIFCELVQWCEDCNTGECTILAQYLGALNDVLFPPNMCSTDGVDLLMRRSKDFPGILSPKIEIATKVRIDEVWNVGCHVSQVKTTTCHCSADADPMRQRQVCHTPQYHRNKCNVAGRRPRSRSRSGGSRSCVSLREPDCKCPNPIASAYSRRSPVRRPRSAGRPRPCPGLTSYNVYNSTTGDAAWTKTRNNREDELDEEETQPSTSRAASPPSSPRTPRAERREINIENRELNTDQRERSTKRQPNTTKCDRSERGQILGDRSNPTIAERKPTLAERSPTLRERLGLQRGRSATRSRRQYKVYNVDTGKLPQWTRGLCTEDFEDLLRQTQKHHTSTEERERFQKIQLESQYIEEANERSKLKDTFKNMPKPKLKPCICEICKRYHELFHSESEYAKS